MLRYLITSARAGLRSRLGRWIRIGAAVLCVLCAAAAALSTSRPRAHTLAAPVALVVVAAHTLPAGQRLRASDLRVAQWPRAVRPAGTAATTSGLVGRRLAGPVGPGEPITRYRLAGSALTAGLPPGSVATPVLVAADVADLVSAGDRVDLIAAAAAAGVSRPRPAATDASVIASGVTVLAVLPPRAADPFGSSATQLVIATDRSTAVRIASLQATENFSVVVDRP